MIEDYQAKRRRNRQLARGLQFGGIVLALVAALVTYAVLAGRPVAVPVETEAVVVAARDLPPRTTLAAGDLRVARLPRETVPRGAASEPAALVGRITATALVEGELVLATKLGTTEAAIPVFPPGTSPSGTAPDLRAVSFAVPDPNAAGGNVQAGDLVDIAVTLPHEPVRLGVGVLDTDQAARIVAERVAVLAKAKEIYTLRLEATQAERLLALAAGGATLHLLLRDAGDTRAPRAPGAIWSNEARTLIRAIPTASPAPSPR